MVKKEFSILIEMIIKMSEDVVEDIGKTIFKKDF